MKKLLLVVAVLALAIGNAYAEEKYVAGGFEASGHINTGFGFSYVGSNGAAANTGGAVALAGALGTGRDGWTGFEFGNKTKDFGFLLDEVELDLTKTYGENIKFRADLNFLSGVIGSAAYPAVEQAYVTANIAAGNGVELLFGRFEAPIGFEAIDRNDNDTVTRSAIFNFGIRPRTLTGMKLYYAFSDAVDLHFYVVNNLEDTLYASFNTDANLTPSAGARLGYTWGDEGKENTVGLSVAAGPETKPAASGKLGNMSFLGDLDWNIWLTDAFALGGEGIFRLDGANTGTADAKLFGGLVNMNYVFSDVWDGTLKYALLSQNAYAATTARAAYSAMAAGKALFHEISAAGGYQITDGAKFVAEYRLDWTKYTGVAKNMSHAFLGNFAYTF